MMSCMYRKEEYGWPDEPSPVFFHYVMSARVSLEGKATDLASHPVHSLLVNDDGVGWPCSYVGSHRHLVRASELK